MGRLADIWEERGEDGEDSSRGGAGLRGETWLRGGTWLELLLPLAFLGGLFIAS